MTSENLPPKLVPRLCGSRRLGLVLRPSWPNRLDAEIVPVWIIESAVFRKIYQTVPNFRLKFVFNRKKKTNRPIFREQITSSGTLFLTGLSSVPCLAAEGR